MKGLTKTQLLNQIENRFYLTLNEADMPEEDAEAPEEEPKEDEGSDDDSDADKIESDIKTNITNLITKYLKIKDVKVNVKYSENPFLISVSIFTDKTMSIKIEYDRDFKVVKGININKTFFEYDNEKAKNLVKILYFLLSSNKLLRLIKQAMASVINTSETKNKVETNLDSEELEKAKETAKADAEKEIKGTNKEEEAPEEAPKESKFAPDEEIEPSKVGFEPEENNATEEEPEAPKAEVKPAPEKKAEEPLAPTSTKEEKPEENEPAIPKPPKGTAPVKK